MEMLSINTESKLVNLAATIGRSMRSWKNWSCLRIQIDGRRFEHEYDCILWAQPIIDAYLGDLDGRAYFCGNLDIHVLCKGFPVEALAMTGASIAELMAEESGVMVSYQIYDLANDGASYVQSVLDVYSSHVGVPVLSQSLMTEDAGNYSIAESGRQPRVLLVEDDPMTRWMVRSALKNECEFATAQDAGKAYEMYNAFKPDIVFLDINLPDANGFLVLEWILLQHAGACVVMFSGNDNLDNITQALKDGASGFVAKPFMKESLMHYVHSHSALKGLGHADHVRH